MASSSSQEQVVSGQAWHEFCEVLKRAGDQILRPEAPPDAFNRAEGFRYLSRLMRIGLEMHVEGADPEFPQFTIPSHETAKIGADNPDNFYQYARLNGRNTYRVHGHRGSVSYLSFGTQKGGYETDGKMTQTGFIDAQTMRFEADGSFELVLSEKPQPVNWLPLEAESNALVVRQTFLHRDHGEKGINVRTERLFHSAGLGLREGKDESLRAKPCLQSFFPSRR